MKKRHILIFAIYILLIPFQLKANTFSFRHYKVEDGLTFNTVRSIIQDRRGFMWIGTEDGLNRFDGYTFKEFRSKAKSKNSIGSNYIGTLLEDSNGDIWIGTDNGVYIYHPTTEKFIRLEIKTKNGVICSSSINNIVEDKLKIYCCPVKL
jgi:ligand-binding sensor domain-containing protein